MPAAPATSLGRDFRTVLEMIKFEHTVFALPFAFLGMVLAADGWPAWRTVGWIVVAMVGARSAAMSFNRLVDREIDAENPRTADRALPAGRLGVGFVAGFVVASCGLLVVAAWQLDPLALALSPLALAIVLGYSYTKRFTSWCHLILGLGLAGAPVGAWIAVRGDVTATPIVLGLAVLFWVAGFDVLYALQDLEFDLGRGLSSIPVRLGVRGSLWVSGLLHLAMVGCLLALPAVRLEGLGAAYWVGVIGSAGFLAYQHSVVRPSDLSRLDAAFFGANGLLAAWLGTWAVVDVLLSGRFG